MKKRAKDIPVTTIYRLSYYYRELPESGVSSFISSQDLAKLTGFSDALVRRDLSYFGRFGIPGKGYLVSDLREKISGILGINRKWKVALIGLGNLGSALLRYKGFVKQGFEIVAVFDSDPGKIGKSRSGLKIQDINQLEKEVKKGQIEMAIIAVPGDAAQEAIDRVVGSGIKAILNFAPVKVNVPDFVSLVNIDFSVELERLSCLATRGVAGGR
jgi:redox-sensing transcriptional repressor